MSALKKVVPVWAITALMLGTLSACNTMEGVGQDVEKAGDSLEDTARENKNY